ncbi:S1C family serine protease [Streptococcus zalophi]|uniref:Serine protease n=1 Tax=Streptococcus zalophi TaxID=640031 RepID=A0A934UDV4_9STRE|nr:S1C family serine protease [Streptococcus zalophi]MBJ8350070.1 serine protease [Streptococcus zalophi]MCR8968154.1 S1C family serine protease [Streptococcus zalophi]
MKKKSSFFKKIINFLFIILFGFLGGFVATFFVLQMNGGNLFSNTTPVSQVKTSNTKYNTVTSTTDAVKTIQNTVVSVINYQVNQDDFGYYDYFTSENEDRYVDDSGLTVFSEGSGVIYKKDGKDAYLVTNNHVISGAQKIEILLSNGSKVVGELVGADTYSDLAVVKIPSENVDVVAEFANSDNLNVGEPAIAIGSPLGSEYANSVTEGIVSSLSRTVTSRNENGEIISTNAIQTDAAINPGNSGGPLINIQGQVIGINSSKITVSGDYTNSVAVEGMGFAIPSNDVVSIINQLEANGSVNRPALGISMASLNEIPTSSFSKLDIPDSVLSGVVVISTQEGMPSDGVLEKNDVIVSIDKETIETTSDLQSVLYKHQINDSIEVTFYRGQKKMTETIQLTKTTEDLKKNE